MTGTAALATTITLVTAILTFAPSTAAEPEVRVLASVAGKFGNWEVLELDGLRILACDGVVQGAVPADQAAITAEALIRGRDYTGLIPFYRPDTRDALLIGLGAGIHVRALESSGIDVHSVDIEPAVVPLAEKYFGFSGEVTVADGRAFLEESDRQFDAMILDTFSGGDMPKQLYTEEAFRRMAADLNPGGVLAVHLIAAPQHPATQAIAKTLGSAFPHVVSLRSEPGVEQIQHLYLLASDRALTLTSEQRLAIDRCGFTGKEFFEVETGRASVLTDETTQLDKLGSDLAEEHRRRSHRLLKRP